jgi:hypothetical protein
MTKPGQEGTPRPPASTVWVMAGVWMGIPDGPAIIARQAIILNVDMKRGGGHGPAKKACPPLLAALSNHTHARLRHNGQA